jgi:excinuclease ABC subunit B
MEKAISQTKKQMEKAAKDLDFIQAAMLRDQMFKMQKELEVMKA